MRSHFPSVVQWSAAGTGLAGLPRVTGDVGRPSRLAYQLLYVSREKKR